MAISVVDGFVVTNATPIDARLVFTSSRVLFESASTDILPAASRYLGMQVYIVPQTCSYTLISGENRPGGGINNGVWASGSVTSSFSISASYALNSNQDLSLYLLSSWTGSSTSQFQGTSSYSSESSTASLSFTTSYVKSPIGDIFFVSASALANTTTSIISMPTASYRSSFLNYTVDSGANFRAGQITTAWSGSETHFYEFQTTDFGDTSFVNWSVFVLNGISYVKIENVSSQIYQIKATVTNI